MTTKKQITEKLLETIKDDMIYGYRVDEGKKQYPTIKVS